MLPNASYFAFTATPKNKTLELFGEPDPQADGTVKHRPFHSYTMKQAVEEGFIEDVLLQAIDLFDREAIDGQIPVCGHPLTHRREGNAQQLGTEP